MGETRYRLTGSYTTDLFVTQANQATYAYLAHNTQGNPAYGAAALNIAAESGTAHLWYMPSVRSYELTLPEYELLGAMAILAMVHHSTNNYGQSLLVSEVRLRDPAHTMCGAVDAILKRANYVDSMPKTSWVRDLDGLAQTIEDIGVRPVKIP